jgi:hypothetical protein
MENIYKITITNWEKHNPNRKKHYKYTLISNNMIYDYKLRALPVSARWLWVSLLLIAGDHARDCIELTERQLRDLLESSWSIPRALDAFQSFQLVTWEFVKTNSHPNRIEENRREENRREVQRGENLKEKPNKDLNIKIWEAYKNEYYLRYRVEPIRNASVNSKVSQLAKRLGTDAIEVVVFFINHNDPFYLKQLHQIGLCLTNAEALYTQWKHGRAILPRDIKQFEQSQNMRDINDAIESGKI